MLSKKYVEQYDEAELLKAHGDLLSDDNRNISLTKAEKKKISFGYFG